MASATACPDPASPERAPGQANDFLKPTRGLVAWATRNAHVEHDSCAGVERLRYRSIGPLVWAPGGVEAFRERHPIENKARVARGLLLTGLRCSDIVRAGREHLQDDVLTIRTVETNAPVSVRASFAIARDLTASLNEDLRARCR